jgi:hypothetical protein
MLTIEGDYPISITPISKDDLASTSAGYVASNVQLLRVLNLLALTGHGGVSEKNLDAGSDLVRVEAKIDIVLAMLGEWLVAQRPLPPVHHVWFSLDKLTVIVAEPLPQGQSVLVELYTSTHVPRPLRFPCTVDRSSEERGRTLMELSIERSEGPVVDELERYVFLLHRRQLGQQGSRPA